MTSDSHSQYDPLIKHIAALYADDTTIHEHLRTLTVASDEWDNGRGGGHLWFGSAQSAPLSDPDTVDAWALDSDGMPIEIILHYVGGRITWGEWYRVDGRPIQRWPPPWVQREAPRFGESPN